MDYHAIVQGVLEELAIAPVDMLGIGDGAGEHAYLSINKESYVRTVRDVDSLCKNNRTGSRILEIGSFLGPVSISLKRIGYNVTATEIPEFNESISLKELYDKNGIQFEGVNLKHSKLPFESNSFDVVIICEVLEHLNFNPLPILKEINRVIKKGGHIYIGMPNQSHLDKRIKFLLGKSTRNSVNDFFEQLDRKSNMIVGLHWREYTLSETIQLIESMGFETIAKYYFAGKRHKRLGALKSALIELLYLYPPFRPFHVVIGRKIEEPDYDFWITDANV